MKTFIKPREMKLADTIKYSPFGKWNNAIVKQITDTDVTLFRPYGATADFSYTGGVICYVGIEEYTIPISSDMEYELLERKELK
jgi:hypothetical protein